MYIYKIIEQMMATHVALLFAFGFLSNLRACKGVPETKKLEIYKHRKCNFRK